MATFMNFTGEGMLKVPVCALYQAQAAEEKLKCIIIILYKTVISYSFSHVTLHHIFHGLKSDDDMFYTMKQRSLPEYRAGYWRMVLVQRWGIPLCHK